jgi:ribonucleotide monophosphatase NagD (HAD superfamily)
MDALLVLTGVTSSADSYTDQPEFVLPSVADLREYF